MFQHYALSSYALTCALLRLNGDLCFHVSDSDGKLNSPTRGSCAVKLREDAYRLVLVFVSKLPCCAVVLYSSMPWIRNFCQTTCCFLFIGFRRSHVVPSCKLVDSLISIA